MEESNVYFEVPIFNSTELEEATTNFSASNELGDGGFGTVYYGKLQDGREVAVKRLYERNYQRVKQFMNEISTAPQGTPGYVDPEYHQCYHLTEKSDVYSFGVVLVELVSSKPAVDKSRERHEINLANFAINKIQKCAFGELIDPNLGFESDSEINRMTTSVAELAFLCLQLDKEMRPPMDEVLEELKAIACNENAADIFVDADKGEGVLAPSPPDYDDSQLLKNMRSTHSPVSVTQKWGSSGSSAPGVDG
ncbi:hypothetical protein NL676_032063 [Syzygium grande]|nr:hypothetical protein NL676_032063 [Syzygium grande]